MKCRDRNFNIYEYECYHFGKKNNEITESNRCRRVCTIKPLRDLIIKLCLIYYKKIALPSLLTDFI